MSVTRHSKGTPLPGNHPLKGGKIIMGQKKLKATSQKALVKKSETFVEKLSKLDSDCFVVVTDLKSFVI